MRLNYGPGTVQAPATDERDPTREARLWQLAENLGEVLWIADPVAQSLVYLSPAFETIWGRPRQDVMGDPDAFLATVHPDDRSRVISFRERAFRGVRGEEEHRIIRPDGTIATIRALAFPVQNGHGELEQIVGLSLDVSERMNLEQRRTQQAKTEAIATLASGLAHELNNRLTGVLGNAALATGMLPVNHPAKELLRQVTTSGERAAGIVGQMLAYAGKGKLFGQPINLSDLVRDFLKNAAPSAPAHVQLRVELAESLPFLQGDRNQILQLMGNLYLNAIEAIGTGPGMVVISTDCKPARAESANSEMGGHPSSGLYLCLRVRDTGCGIEDAIRPRIFDPFFSTKFIGRGLGLAAAEGIVRAHHGVIRVSSKPGNGSTFTCLFPLA